MSIFDVPDQPLNPPEPRIWPVATYEERLEHEADRLNDEARERELESA